MCIIEPLTFDSSRQTFADDDKILWQFWPLNVYLSAFHLLFVNCMKSSYKLNEPESCVFSVRFVFFFAVGARRKSVEVLLFLITNMLDLVHHINVY